MQSLGVYVVQFQIIWDQFVSIDVRCDCEGNSRCLRRFRSLLSLKTIRKNWIGSKNLKRYDRIAFQGMEYVSSMKERDKSDDLSWVFLGTHLHL